jgi:hypothetical protein
MRALMSLMMLGYCLMATPILAQPAAKPNVAATEVQVSAPKQGLLALLRPNPEAKAERVALRADRKAQRIAAREARSAARVTGRAKVDSTDVASRAAVEHGVQFALDNKPQGRWWCVPFARMVTGLSLRGNAKTWWEQAKGRYQRSQEPKVGAVMAFAASSAMPKGHVAVVSGVISDREILVVHANWARGKVTLNDRVVDVSESGDWSRVRVENSGDSLGRVNPVNGFIYKG